MELKEFIDWYSDASKAADLSPALLINDANYLQGFCDASKGNENMRQIVRDLTGTANALMWLHTKAGTK